MVLEVAGVEEAVARRVAGAEAERAGGQAEHQRQQQAGGAGLQRMDGGDHRAQHDQSAGREQDDRRGVADAAEGEQHRARQRLAHLAAGPVEIEDAREEGGERDQPEADQVPVALLEDRELRDRATTPCAQGVASGVCGWP